MKSVKTLIALSLVAGGVVLGASAFASTCPTKGLTVWKDISNCCRNNTPSAGTTFYDKMNGAKAANKRFQNDVTACITAYSPK